MPNHSVDPVERQRDRDREMRAAVDVMFEALAHIQASLETSSEEKRMESYQKFKEALYERFEHLLDEQEAPVGEQTEDPCPEKTSDRDGPVIEDDEEDTLEKMWPAVTENR